MMTPPAGVRQAQVQREVARPTRDIQRQKIFVWRRGAVFYVFVMLATALASLVLVNLSQKALIAQGGIEVQRLKGLIETEKARNERLAVKRTQLKTPQRIEKIAEEELGMITPLRVHYLVLPPRISDVDVAVEKSAAYKAANRSFTEQPLTEPR